MNITFNINIGRVNLFFHMQGHNTLVILCKKYFLSSNHQKLQWSHRNEIFFVQHKQSQQNHQLKKDEVIE